MYSFEVHVSCSSFIVHEDMDVRSSVIGKLHKNSGFVHIRLGEVVDSIAALKTHMSI